MFTVTSEQVKGMLDRAIAVAATMFLSHCVKKGWIGESDSATLLPALVLLPSLIWGWYVNRNKALIQAAANTVDDEGRKPIIVSSPEMAKSNPETKIVSNTTSAVVTIVDPKAPSAPPAAA